MPVFEIRGRHASATPANSRTACRGILIRDGRILLSWERNTDQYFLPGGGLEPGECLSACCVRELAEETGVVVKAEAPFLTIREYYGDWCWISHYFVCTELGTCPVSRTEQELRNGLEPVWLPLDQALEIFGGFDGHSGWKRGAYAREFRVLQEFLSPQGASAPEEDAL